MSKLSFRRAALAVVTLVGAVGAAQAHEDFTPTYGARDEGRIGVGLQWNFGAWQPEVVVAARWTHTQTDSTVTGVKADVAIPVLNGWVPTVRVLGLAGDRDIQAEFGFGYRFATSQFLVGVGAEAPFVNGGVNYTFGQGLGGYAGVNSLGRVGGPKVGSAVAPPPPPP